MKDPVNPAHYKGDYVMRVIEDFGLDFLDGTTLKYILRSGRKPDEPAIIDYKKARWYLDRKIQNLESASAKLIAARKRAGGKDA
jgi:hypothetical protein